MNRKLNAIREKKSTIKRWSSSGFPTPVLNDGSKEKFISITISSLFALLAGCRVLQYKVARRVKLEPVTIQRAL